MMPATSAHPAPATLLEAERRAIVGVLRSHPEWTLEQLARLIADHVSPALESVTVGDLLACRTGFDQRRFELASNAQGEEFELCVLDVICEANGRPVGAVHLRERVGGPRWKLQTALRNLLDHGFIRRSGSTSGTRYWIETEPDT